MARALLLLCVLACVAAPAFADIWTSCGTAADKFKVDTVKITPDPPAKGQNITVAVTGSLSETVTSGNIKIDLKYSVVTVVSKTVPLCSTDTEIKCPVPAGAFSPSITENIPDNVPTGDYTGHITATDENGAEIACVNLKFKL